MTTQHITLTVNGEAREADVEPRLLLVHLLRDNFGLTGTHIGCDTSNCGACTVHVERSERQVLHDARRPGRRRRDHDDRGDGRRAPSSTRSSRRSGTSTACSAASARPGMIMQAAWLLGQNPDPDRGRDPRGHQRQPLPLHRLREHRQGDPAGGRRAPASESAPSWPPRPSTARKSAEPAAAG